MIKHICWVIVVQHDFMDYPEFVEICGNCHTVITWDKKGDAVCKCMDTKLQFIEKEEAIKLGILKE